MNASKLNLLVYFIINSFNFIIIQRYYHKLFGKIRKKKPMLAITALAFLTFFTIFIRFELPYVNLVNISAWSLLFLFFYSGEIKNKILFGFLLIAFAGICQGLSYHLYEASYKNFFLNSIFTAHLLFFGFLEISARVCKVKKNKLNILVWIALLTIPIVSIIALPCIFLLAQSSRLSLKGIYGFLVPVYIIILYINLIAFYLFDKLSILIETLKNNAVLEKQIEYQADYYYLMNENNERIRRIKHDMKNNLETLNLLAKDQKYWEVGVMLDELVESTIEVEKVINTGNPAIDAILNIKLSVMLKKAIKIDKKINIPSNLQISFKQASAVLGNALDNAIEATEKVEEENRYIMVELNYINNSIFIYIKNYFDAGITNIKMLSTKKEDKLLHGIGLNSIRKTVQEMEGYIQTEVEGHFFMISIVLYMK